MAESVDFSLERLEILKQANIKRFLEVINLETIMGFYDSLVEHTFHGEFDEEFLSKSLLGLDSEEKGEIFQLARKYKGLCFYAGSPTLWADSIGGVTLSDVDLVCMRLLDNYDFLLGLAKDGGEQALKQLNQFQGGTMASSGSVIDSLRRAFSNDDVLKDIVIEMSKSDGKYKGLSDKQKEILCTYPMGVLFDVEDQKTKIVPPKDLLKRLITMYVGSDTDEIPDFETLSKVISDEDEFESTVLDVFYDQQDAQGYYAK